jgi:hypothetical protein
MDDVKGLRQFRHRQSLLQVAWCGRPLLWDQLKQQVVSHLSESGRVSRNGQKPCGFDTVLMARKTNVTLSGQGLLIDLDGVVCISIGHSVLKPSLASNQKISRSALS